uniref:MYND-type domain-containing protein n=1 Tax=Tetradesmus obliquus TaxID=3088 RepID=A0A383V5G8_TETOB|eukprot:jgi/Sobl393_1/1341/SZX59814.1
MQFQQQQQPSARRAALELLTNCNSVLGTQILFSLKSTTLGCLPPEVLQQAGQQLLQALGAPLQLLKLLGRQAIDPETLSAALSDSARQLFMLRAAAEGTALGHGTTTVRPGHLAALAAAHPEAYTSFIDCCVRSEQLPPQAMLMAAQLLAVAVNAVLNSGTALADTAAVAGLSSALTSLVKRTVQLIKAAASMQQRQAAAAAGTAAEHFLAAAPRILEVLFINTTLSAAATRVPNSSSSSSSSNSSSSSSSEVHASCVLLGVVVARSVVQLADAMEAAGPQLLFDWLMAGPEFTPPAATATAGGGGAGASTGGCSTARHRSGEANSGSTVTGTAGKGSSSSSSSSSNSSSQQLKWGYLLNLQQSSTRWAAAAAEYRAAMQASAQQLAADGEDAHPAACPAAQVGQQYQAAVKLCRALAAAAPVPALCNNPGCENLAGVSEAAAASKACAGCRCRYCSAACQTADWKRHKHACRRMAAAGVTCG